MTSALISFILPAFRVASNDAPPMPSVSSVMSISSLYSKQCYHKCLDLRIFIGLVSGSGITDFMATSTFDFTRYGKTVLQGGHTNLHSPQVPVSPHPYQQHVVRFNNVLADLIGGHRGYF